MAEARSLDIPEQQMAVDFWDDPNFPWHMRVLLVPGGQDRGVWATPDLEIQVRDLAQHRAVAVGRNAPYSAAIGVNLLHAFDPLPAEDLARLRSEARILAQVLGFDGAGAGPPGEAPPHGVISGTAGKAFGEEVPGAVVADAGRFDGRGAAALVSLLNDADGNARWTSCQNVRFGNHQRWMDEKLSDRGRGCRVQPIRRQHATEPRRQSLERCLEAQRTAPQDNGPFRGPKAVSELVDAALFFVAKKGGSTRRIVDGRQANSLHRMLPHASMASVEALSALRVGSQLMASRLDETGGVVTLKFDEWVAQGLKTQAIIMKNTRLLQEERESDAKRLADPKGKAGAKGDHEK